MTSTHRQFFTCITLLACSIIYNFYLLKIPVNIYDEGIVLAGADRVLKGQLPCLDFWTMYPPGQYFTLAFLFKLFGTSILTERIYDIAIRSLLSTLAYVTTKKFGSSDSIAITGWSIALIYMGDFGFPVYPVYFAILLILAGLFFVVDYIESNKTQHLIYAGIIITVSSLFRHDLAGMAAISVLFTLFMRKALEKKACLHSGLTFIFGILLAGLPIFIYLVGAIGIPLIVDQLLLTPAEIMPRYRWLPYPTSLSFNSIQFYTYPFVLFTGLFASLFIIVRLKIYNRLNYGIFLLSLVGILFLNQARVRSDSIHLLPAVMLCTIVGPSLFYAYYKYAEVNTKEHLSRFGAYLLLILITIPLASPAFKKIKSIDSHYFSLPDNSYRSGYAGIGGDLQDLVFYLRNNTNKDDAIYVGVDNHDRFVINDVIIYFLADRRYATKYHELHPGVTNKKNIQNDIIQEIEDASVKTIVLAARYWNEPNETRVDSKIDILDNYILENYDVAQKFGAYEVWIRKSSDTTAQSDGRRLTHRVSPGSHTTK